MQIKKITNDEFFSFFSTEMPKLFDQTLRYSIMDVRTQHELASFERLKTAIESNECLNLALYDENNKLAGWSSTRQMRPYEFYSWNSAVYPEHRRKGFYSLLVKETIKEAKRLGYQMVTSNHVMSNNDVIIAKLKLGFQIMGIETFDDYGTTVKLVYHLNETRKKAFDFRTGFKRPDHEIKTLFEL